MTINYTTLLGLTEPVTGTQSGTWGSDINTGLTDYVEAAIAGAQVISGSQTAVTLSVTTGSSSAPTTLSQAGSGATGSSQYQIIRCTGNPAGLLTITAPASDKTYVILNATSTSQSVKIVGAGPTTGVTIVSGERAFVAWNGSDFVKVGGAAGGTNTQVQFNDNGVFGGSANLTWDGSTLATTGLTASGAVTLSATTQNIALGTSQVGGTWTAGGASQTGAITLDQSTKTHTLNIGTGATENALTKTINLGTAGVSGSTTAINIGSAVSGATSSISVNGALTASGNVTLSGGTANGVLYLNGSKVATSGSAVTYNGTTFSTSADASVNGITVGRGAGAVSTNTAVGASALQANSTGSLNTALGYQALYTNSTGAIQTAVGYQAGYTKNGTGDGVGSTFIGGQAGKATTTGADITFVGANAGLSNTTGSFNVALGASALQSNTTASNNTAVGYFAAYANTTGQYNTAVGYAAFDANTTGSGNTAVGQNAIGANTAGADNTGIGYGALGSGTSGSQNTAVGRGALSDNTGSNNTALGYFALISNTTASNNTAVGYQAGYTNATGTRCAFFGAEAGKNTTTSDNTFIGNNAGNAITTGDANTILGRFSGNEGGLDIRTSSNYIVLSDGDGNPLVSTADNQTVALEGAVPNSGTGITFPATQSASSNANTLDDYEEGTFTATTAGSTSGTITLNSGVDLLAYTKIGRVVFVQGLLEVSSVSSPVGTSVLVQNLPFTTADLSEYAGRGGTACFAKGSVRGIQILEGETRIYVVMDASTVASGDQFYLSFNYIAA